jgi:glycerol-3-phosphate O-acyltransferase
MVRDARVILSREVRHSILKITPGGDNEKESVLAEEETTTIPPSTSEELHDRHVETEHSEHEQR